MPFAQTLLELRLFVVIRVSFEAKVLDEYLSYREVGPVFAFWIRELFLVWNTVGVEEIVDGFLAQ